MAGGGGLKGFSLRGNLIFLSSFYFFLLFFSLREFFSFSLFRWLLGVLSAAREGELVYKPREVEGRLEVREGLRDF